MGPMRIGRPLALVLLGAAALLSSACGDGGKAKSIKVVIAEYSKDHTRPFWQSLARSEERRVGKECRL